MRIRSIRPEFWSSEDIAALTWEQRLIYIGLWSYVDDNGVGRDVTKLIAADLFPLDDDTHGALKQIAGALKLLCARGMITRYTVSGKPYLHITAWETHQKINRPSGARYPLPTCGNAEPHDTLTEPSVSPHADSPVGEGEKGRRGEGEKYKTRPAEPDTFDEWWSTYPRKEGKGRARPAYTKAIRDVPADKLLRLTAEWFTARPDLQAQFIPQPASWLNARRWED